MGVDFMLIIYQCIIRINWCEYPLSLHKEIHSCIAFGTQIFHSPQKRSTVVTCRSSCAGAARSIKVEGAKILRCMYKIGRGCIGASKDAGVAVCDCVRRSGLLLPWIFARSGC